MKVYAWIKHKIHPNPTIGSTRGDLIYIYPIVEDQGKLTHDSFFPVVVDLTIPCGEKFTVTKGIRQWNCNGCKDNDVELCEFQKYQQAVVLIDDTVVTKHRYKIEVDNVLSVSDKEIFLKTDNSEEEKTLIISIANTKPIAKIVLEDKTEVSIIKDVTK